MLTVAAIMKLRGYPNDQSNARSWLERFERMRAAGGFRPISIGCDARELMERCELPADAILIAAANED